MSGGKRFNLQNEKACTITGEKTCQIIVTKAIELDTSLEQFTGHYKK
jgi:hypothetical protein